MPRLATLVLALVVSAATVVSGQSAEATAPFYDGITDAASVTRGVNERLAAAQAAMERLTTVGGRRTVENTLRPYDEIQRHGQAAAGLANIVRQLHPDADLRAAAERALQQVTTLSSNVALNRAIYDALAAIDLQGATPEERHYVQRELAAYRRQGVNRDEATRKRIAALRDEHQRLAQEFDRNVRQGVRRITVASVDDLAGLPADFIAAHQPDASGAITITTEAPDLQPVMLYARSDDLRKRLLLASQNVAYPENVPVLERLLAVRAELARTLGYRDWAAYDIEDRMAGTSQNAAAFIDKVVAASARRADADYRELLLRKRRDVPDARVVEAWERRYYTELVRQANYNFDSQAVRPYLAYEQVRQGVLDVASRLFGFEFRPVSALRLWHASVRAYEVFENGERVARIYLDMHPRPNKGGSGASSATARPGVAGVQTAEVVLICRFPGGQEGEPGLMTHDQVTTFFHEFGHLVHAIAAGRQKWAGLTRVAERDFIEAPSQMLEEWAWDPATLATFARHYQTNEPIPGDLVRQMRRASELGRGYDVRQQMVFAGVSLAMHDRDPKRADPVAIHRRLVQKYLPTPWTDGVHFAAAFTHLANPNYTAAYYTYMWSQVIAKDLFGQFDRANLLAPETARRYRQTVLEPGGARPAADLVRAFLGRPFNFAAWEQWLNADRQ